MSQLQNIDGDPLTLEHDFIQPGFHKNVGDELEQLLETLLDLADKDLTHMGLNRIHLCHIRRDLLIHLKNYVLKVLL